VHRDDGIAGADRPLAEPRTEAIAHRQRNVRCDGAVEGEREDARVRRRPREADAQRAVEHPQSHHAAGRELRALHVDPTQPGGERGTPTASIAPRSRATSQARRRFCRRTRPSNTRTVSNTASAGAAMAITDFNAASRASPAWRAPTWMPSGRASMVTGNRDSA